MANLPNITGPSEQRQPHPSEVAPPRPKARPVSFDIAGATQRPQGGGAANPGLPLPTKDASSRLLVLPKGKRPLFSRHRHDANPVLALKVLQDIQTTVEAWHGELRQTVHHIQALYMEGPIVDGWLETVEMATAQPSPGLEDAAILRHGDAQTLSGYVDHLCQVLEQSGSEGAKPDGPPAPTAAPSYRLCSLNPDGQVQCLPCPPEQLSTLSLAIARHQKLRQLLDQKRYLEAKLKRAVEVLTGSRDTLGIAPTCSSTPDLETS